MLCNSEDLNIIFVTLVAVFSLNRWFNPSHQWSIQCSTQYAQRSILAEASFDHFI